jgi:hypothetical protein
MFRCVALVYRSCTENAPPASSAGGALRCGGVPTTG